MKVIVKDTQEVKDVKFGYAVHYLIPQGLAEPATQEKLDQLRQKQLSQQAQQTAQVKKDRQAADKLLGATITITAKGKKDDRLYGSVGKQKIKTEVKKLLGKSSPDIEVELSTPIKTVGEHQVDLKIGGANAKVRVSVQAEK